MLKSTDSLMVMEVGISVQRRANLTGVTSSCGSRSTWACSMRRQKEARRSKGSVSSIMHRKMSSTSSCLEISSMARYWRSRHMRAKSFSWYLSTEKDTVRLLSVSEWLQLSLTLWRSCHTDSRWEHSHREHFLVLPPEPAAWCSSPVSRWFCPSTPATPRTKCIAKKYSTLSSSTSLSGKSKSAEQQVPTSSSSP